MNRICRVCSSKESEWNTFTKGQNLCKKCHSDYDKKRDAGPYKKRRKKLRRQYYLKHAEEHREQKRLWRQDFKKRDPEGYKKLCAFNNKKHIEKEKRENPSGLREKRTLATKRYVNKNRKKHNKYNRDLYQNSTKFRLAKLLRQRVKTALKSSKKLQKTMDLLGCTIEQLKAHLQQTALNNGYKNFNIENYNGSQYHIDHIIPCASFDLTKLENQKICFNYKNLQILEENKNRRKWKFIKELQNP